MTYESDNVPQAAAPASPSVAASGAAQNPISPPPTAATAPAPAKPTDSGTLNGDPRGPRAADWQPLVDAAMPHLQACFDDANLAPGSAFAIAMHYTVEPRGETGAVTAKGQAPRTVLDCCERVIENVKLPPFGGPKVERDLSFTWFKRAADGGMPVLPK
ncbi:MAG TPA: hypothetical protein VN947_07420 [Polyangia bacterium]|nr:hypothetical protein [Polyangia bacterium]